MQCISGEGSSFTDNHQSRRSLSAGVAFISEPNLSAGTRPPNPYILRSYRHRPRSKPAKQFSVRFVLATGSHPMLLGKLCGKWKCKRYIKRPIYMAVVFPLQVHQYFIIIIHQVLFHLIHTSIHPSHHTHLTTLSLSWRQVRLPLVPCLNGQRRIQHKPRGR